MKKLWLLGNGPSLKHVDLDMLMGEEVWVLNRFHLVQEPDLREGIKGTGLRPSRWWWMDSPWDTQQWEDLGMLINRGELMYVRHTLIAEALSRGLVEHPFNENLTAVLHDSSKEWEDSQISWVSENTGFPKWVLVKNDHKWLAPCRGDFPKVYPHLVWRFTNSMAVMLQSAALDEYDEVYLLGCDMGFGYKKESHFHSNYYGKDYKHYMGTNAGEQNNQSIRVTHVFAKIAFDELGIRCFNANPDNLGDLDVWDRVDYREVLSGRS